MTLFCVRCVLFWHPQLQRSDLLVLAFALVTGSCWHRVLIIEDLLATLSDRDTHGKAVRVGPHSTRAVLPKNSTRTSVRRHSSVASRYPSPD